MALSIIYGDITTIECDAIVNAANFTLLGGVDGAIHKAAGFGLLFECMKLGGCKVGEAKITKGYKLPCNHIIHTVGPKWRGGNKNEAILLHNCYINSLNLAISHGCNSVAFPLIFSGIYGCPKETAMSIVVEAINSFLTIYDLQVYMVLYEN